MPKQKTHRIVLFAALGLTVLIAAGMLYAWGASAWGESLPQRPSPTAPLTALSAATESTEALPAPADGDLPGGADSQVDGTPSAQGSKPVCNGPASMNVLVLGIDDHAQADAIRLVHIDFVTPAVTALSIPRDFYVPIVDMGKHGITQGRINAAYGYGEHYLGTGQGVFSLAENLYHNFGVSFDHYVVIQFSAVAKLIDNIGGVTVHLEAPAADDGHYFAAGDHLLDGETAIEFMRIRYYDTDFHRIDRQTLVLQALLKKAKEDLTLIQQTQLALAALNDRAIQTSITMKTLPPLMCLGRKLDKGNVYFVQIPKELYHPATTTSGGAVQIPHDGAADFIQNIMSKGYNPAE